MEIGRSFGHYEIREPLGSGGMGEVYVGWDRTLQREVAIKVIREDRDIEPADLARFEREAKLLASLNHPNIAVIHGFEEHEGTRFIVLELIEGDTMTERLQRGALPTGEALVIAYQISKALEAAHRGQVMHRDLKPDNIKITAEGDVKVLDFGLAKSIEPRRQPLEDSSAATRDVDAITQTDAIVGTVPYMSPERLKGDEVDKRSDIWAFGCLLFEMLTRRRAFPGSSMPDTLSAILREEPDWSLLPSDLPPPVAHVLRRCLQKNPRQRLQDIGDARIELADAIREPTAEQDAVGNSRAHLRAAERSPLAWRLLPWVAAGAALLLAVWAWQLGNDGSGGGDVLRFSVNIPTGLHYDATARSTPGSNLALSRDGTRLAFVAESDDGITRLMLQDVGSFEVREIPSTEGATLPFFSPEGAWLGFFADGMLKKVLLADGGDAQDVTVARRAYGATWTLDGAIIYTPTDRSGLWRVSEEGGVGEQITTPASGELEHDYPILTPDGDGVLYTAWTNDGFSVGLLDLNTMETETLLEGQALAHYVQGGYLVYGIDNSIFAQPYDLSARRSLGAPVAVISAVATDSFGLLPHFSVSANGTLAYAQGGAPILGRSLVWVDPETGAEEELTAETNAYADPRFAPDGSRVAVTVKDRIQVLDIERATFTHVTLEGRGELSRWSTDSEWIFFSAEIDGASNLYRIHADGSRDAEALLPPGGQRWLDALSADGQYLLYTELREGTQTDILALAWEVPGSIPIEVAAGSDHEYSATFSPDGQWIAYVTNESGGYEVYIRPFRGPGNRSMVSVGGGVEPMWSPAGDEIFYRRGNSVMAVAVDPANPDERPGEPRELFSGPYLMAEPHSYDVGPDGRFLMVKEAEGAVQPLVFRLVVNWIKELDAAAAGTRNRE